MKTLRKQDTLAQTGVMFYEEERDIMTEAVSPWITALHYAFQDSQLLYLVMDFHPGGDLMTLLDRFDGVLEEETARFYLAEIALALHDLHAMGYVHRDVKPENVLLDRCGHVKLADFGSAKDCDYWSLGVVAFEMLTGRTPFSDDKLGSTYNNIQQHKKHLVRPSEPALSDAAWSLIAGLLTDNNRRLAHADVLQHAFFTSVDWNNIANTVPPFIPTVNGVDDTSNFDEVSPEPPSPSLDSLLSQQKFSGRELPFIGFTFTKPLGETRPLKDRSVLSAKVDEKSERLQKIEEERNRLEAALARAEDKSAGYVRLLEVEKKDRMSTEKRALELLQDIKRKWKRDEEERLKVIQDEVKRYQAECKSMEEKYHFSLENL
ncbi:citron Rho-interacting kinase-like [Pollicipes pollicipes]|uniref:citron Rho-interacting kinase-like n=1 Tax=Pollicipes pollicipes TaxID=41117 RepID=UPI0018856C44|nr:citron Rho-interacting kinase-like [Pollicipes pollicipes]